MFARVLKRQTAFFPPAYRMQECWLDGGQKNEQFCPCKKQSVNSRQRILSKLIDFDCTFAKNP
jgi:hypothetical protein